MTRRVRPIMRGINRLNLGSRRREHALLRNEKLFRYHGVLLRKDIKPIQGPVSTHLTVSGRRQRKGTSRKRPEPASAPPGKLPYRRKSRRTRDIKAHETAVLPAPNRIFGTNLLPHFKMLSLCKLHKSTIRKFLIISHRHTESVSGRQNLPERLPGPLLQDYHLGIGYCLRTILHRCHSLRKA